MTAEQRVDSESTLVSRLRAAGCVFAEEEAQLLLAAAGTPTELADMVQRRISGLPLEHVLGWAEFTGLRVAVDPGVFVPRRRTEFLAEQAIALARRARGPATGEATRAARTAAGPGGIPRRTVVVDLCCGSGAVAVAVHAALGHAGSRHDSGPAHHVELYAVDLDPAAAACARRNLHGTGAEVHQGDLYQPLPARLRGRIDVLVANAPYVPTDAVALMPPEARVHESALALDGGPDGLDILRRVITGAPVWLAPGGHLLVESGRRQAQWLAQTMSANGLRPSVRFDEEREATVVVGTAVPTAR